MKSTRYWFSIGDGKSYGLYSLTELQGFKKDGRLSAQTQLCDESSTQWVAASSVITDFVPAVPRTDSDAPTKWTPSLSDVAPMGVAPDAPADEATKWPPPPNSDIAELRANADPLTPSRTDRARPRDNRVEATQG